jgi:hypothetical protein
VVAGITFTYHNIAITSTTPAAHHTDAQQCPRHHPHQKNVPSTAATPERRPDVAIDDGASKSEKVSY